MKIKEIEKICKKKREIVTVELPEKRMFVGTCAAKYYIGGLYKYFLADEYLDLFGVSSKDAGKWYTEDEIAENEAAEDYKDTVTGEEVYPSPIDINFDGIEMSIFKNKDGKVWFVPKEFVAPYKKDNEIFYTIVDGTYLAVKRGMYLDGLIVLPRIDTYRPLEEIAKGLIKIVSGMTK